MSPLSVGVPLVSESEATGEPERGRFDRLCAQLDPPWIEAAVRATGTVTRRRRRGPAEPGTWLVLGMALLRNRPIAEVVETLDLALPDAQGRPLARRAIPPARARGGAEPRRWLFEQTAATWTATQADRARGRGLAVYGVDGTIVRVPDSPANRAHVGGRGQSGDPLVRRVTLRLVRSHRLAAARVGPHGVDERARAQALWPQVPADALGVVDRHVWKAGGVLPLAGDGLVERPVSHRARRRDPTLPRTWVVRAIQAQRRGVRPQWRLTSLLDPGQSPAAELVALSHERWEMELADDEVKTERLEREEAIRSQRPTGVAQELWGVGLLYNLIRLEMGRAAVVASVPPTRISFVAALRLIRDEWLWAPHTSPGALPRHLRELTATPARLVLPPRRSHRAYPRAMTTLSDRHWG